jgi:hypothetical protein
MVPSGLRQASQSAADTVEHTRGDRSGTSYLLWRSQTVHSVRYELMAMKTCPL